MADGPALLVIRSLDTGGAQRQLVALAGGLALRGRRVAVVTLYPGGALEPELRARGVPHYSLDKRGRWDLLGPLLRYRRLLHREVPQAIYGFLPSGQLLASLGHWFGGARVIWGVRSTALDWSRYSPFTRLVYALAARLAHTADLVIANASGGAESHGIMTAPVKVVPNGIDTTAFVFDPGGRRARRAEWGLPEDALVIGIVARLDPMKDHPTFLHAAARLREVNPSATFMVVGDGDPAWSQALHELAAELGLDGHVRWLGTRDDLPAIYSALDIACSSSAFGEGFSNSVAEAMACQTPCVVTDCGDSALIVGTTGAVVPPRDPVALAAALDAMSHEDLAAKGRTARARIEEHFSLERMVARTEQLLWE